MVPTGQIALYENGTQLDAGYLDANGNGVLHATLSAGTHNLVVGYGGDNNYNGANSDPIPVTIGSGGKITPTVTGTVSVNGNVVTMTINVA